MSAPRGRGKSATAEERAVDGVGLVAPAKGPRSTVGDSWIRLFAAFSGAVVALSLAYGSAVAGVFLVLMACALPPSGVTWRPVNAMFVMTRYVPFAIVWVAFTTGYLRLVAAFGHQIPPQAQLESMLEMGGLEWLGMLITVVVVAPVVEEILFRGYLFTALSKSLPMWAAQFVTAALFGLVHGWDYAVPVGVLSLFFGYLRQRYGSLFPSILAHAVHNGVTVGVVMTWPSALDLLHNR